MSRNMINTIVQGTTRIRKAIGRIDRNTRNGLKPLSKKNALKENKKETKRYVGIGKNVSKGVYASTLSQKGIKDHLSGLVKISWPERTSRSEQ